jgi:hypothetical protein
MSINFISLGRFDDGFYAFESSPRHQFEFHSLVSIFSGRISVYIAFYFMLLKKGALSLISESVGEQKIYSALIRKLVTLRCIHFK